MSKLLIVLLALFGAMMYPISAVAASAKPKDGESCTPTNFTGKTSPTSRAGQPRLRRGLEPWETVPAGECRKTVKFANGQLPITQTQYCEPAKKVFVTVQGFPGCATQIASFEYCSCTGPASVRLEPSKYDVQSHIVCNGGHFSSPLQT